MKDRTNLIIIIVVVIIIAFLVWPAISNRNSDSDLESGDDASDNLASTTAFSSDDGAMADAKVAVERMMSAVGAAPAAATMNVNAFFNKGEIDPDACGRVYQITRRVPMSTAVARASLTELLKGPTTDEVAAGLKTALNPDVTINSLMIADGVAKVDFSGALNQGVAGACRVAAVRARIESTLKQFSTVSSVVISVNGETEGILEP